MDELKTKKREMQRLDRSSMEEAYSQNSPTDIQVKLKELGQEIKELEVKVEENKHKLAMANLF